MQNGERVFSLESASDTVYLNTDPDAIANSKRAVAAAVLFLEETPERPVTIPYIPSTELPQSAHSQGN